MISPTKHNHPDKTVLFVSYLILSELKRHTVRSFDSLFAKVKSNNPHLEHHFIYAINLLFCLGLIRYSKKNDNFTLVEIK